MRELDREAESCHLPGEPAESALQMVSQP